MLQEEVICAEKYLLPEIVAMLWTLNILQFMFYLYGLCVFVGGGGNKHLEVT